MSKRLKGVTPSGLHTDAIYRRMVNFGAVVLVESSQRDFVIVLARDLHRPELSYLICNVFDAVCCHGPVPKFIVR